MLDAKLKTQLKAYLERVTQPIEMVASLDDGAKSVEMRNLLQEVYFGKAKDVVGDLRSIPPLSQANKDRATQREMISSMGR